MESSANAGACSSDTEKRPFGVEIDPTLGITLSADADETDDEGNPIFSTQLAVCILTILPQHQNRIHAHSILSIEHWHSPAHAVFSLWPSANVVYI